MNTRNKLIKLSLALPLTSTILFALASCARPDPSPDQAVTGSVLGAAIESGAGAIVGNQVGAIGPGAAIGAGFGVISGGLTGFGLDRNEKTEAEMKARLDTVKEDSSETRARLQDMQARIDYGKIRSVPAATYQVFFDENQTNLRLGAIGELEHLADALLKNDSFSKVTVVGHSDDTGNADYNQKLSQKRAEAVAAYLIGRGLASGSVVIQAKGSSEPIATNDNAEGRSLNRSVTVTIN